MMDIRSDMAKYGFVNVPWYQLTWVVLEKWPYNKLCLWCYKCQKKQCLSFACVF